MTSLAQAPSPIVMLIEDDPSFTYLLQRYTRRSGCRMVGAKLGREALTLIQRTQPAVIVLDMALQRMAALEMLQALKNDLTTSKIPVVICSGLEQEAPGLEAGADVCLSKPVMYYDFLTALADAGVDLPTATKPEDSRVSRVSE